MQITSSAFGNNTPIPDKYTCSCEGISPPLNFSDIPEDTKSLAWVENMASLVFMNYQILK